MTGSTAIFTDDTVAFIRSLAANNKRDWFKENKATYERDYKEPADFFGAVMAEQLETLTGHTYRAKVFRIYRDVRFSKDKTPYNVHRSASFSRAGAHRRGGYYLRLEPGSSAMAGGFFSPEPTDLLRIRKEFEMDTTEIRAILNQKDLSMKSMMSRGI